MDEMKEEKEKDQKIHEKKKQQFIREQLRPQRKKLVLHFLQRAAMVFGAAVLFGGIAALSFYIMQIYFPWQDLDDGIDVIASNRPSADTGIVSKTISDELDENILDSLDSYEEISRQLSAIGEHANAAVVGLGNTDEDVQNSAKAREVSNSHQRYCGILFHENAQHYYILAEYAASRREKNIRIGFLDGKITKGTLVGQDSSLNLAVFRVDKSDFSAEEQGRIVIAALADTSSLSLGTYVLAVGKPNGNLFSVHSATLTEKPITVPITDRELVLFTTSIPYQVGRSGFVLNVHGQLLGMLTTSYSNITGEVDSAFVSFSGLTLDINLLLQGKTLPYLGVTGNNINKEKAKSLGIMEGIYVDSVDASSPAYHGKMRVADIITEVDGQQVHSVQELHGVLAKKQEGDAIGVTVYRQVNGNNQKMKLKATLK